MKVLNKTYSESVYKELAAFEGDLKTVWVDFELWKTNSPGVLKYLWKNLLEWDCKEGEEKAAL